MKTSDTEAVIRRALEGRMADGAAASALARSIAASISYDAGLQQLDENDLETAVSASPTTEHHVIMAQIREKRREKANATEPRPAPADEKTVNIGFFLRCWDAYSRDGHLGSIRMLTVTFLADWLLNDRSYIQPDEVDWCARKALKETGKGNPGDMKTREAFHEAVVLLVMEKFSRSMKNNPEKTGALIEGWRKEYGEYCRKKFGGDPEPVPTGFMRGRSAKVLNAIGA